MGKTLSPFVRKANNPPLRKFIFDFFQIISSSVIVIFPSPPPNKPHLNSKVSLFEVSIFLSSCIPKWDNYIVPKWYNNVKRILKKSCKKGEKMVFRLKELRKSRNISQLKLANDLNMNQNSISRYENLEREADYETLVKFADYFDVSLDYLFGRTDENDK